MDHTANSSFNKNAIPIRWGILLAVLLCVLTTVQYMFLIDKYLLFMFFWLVTFGVSIACYCIAGIQQRKAMGGYIEFKEAFRAIFIVIVISSIISGLYGILYVKLIDPNVMDKIKESTLAFMESVDTPQDKLDEAAEDFDKRVADSNSIGKMFLGLLTSIIVSSIFGFICAAIIKKKKPIFDA